MGKRTRKTRWRTLEIGDSDSEESCSHQPQSTPRGFHPRPYYSKFHTFSSSQSTPTRRFNNGCDNNKSTRSSSTASDTKITFNEDEYTKITTPRQDVLFKKGYLNKPRTYQTQTSTGNSTSASTGNSTGNGTPDHQSADGTECTDVEYESQFVFPTFLDHNGIYYVNSFEPYPLMMYNPQVCYPEFPVSRTKRLSTGSLTESTSPNNEEIGTQSGGENGAAQDLGHPMYMYQGFYYNNPSSSTVVVDVPTTEPRKIKKKRRRKASKSVHDDELSSSEEESSEEPTQIENKSVKVNQLIEEDKNEKEFEEEVKRKDDNKEGKEEENVPLEMVQEEESSKMEDEIEKIEPEEESSKKETKFNLNAEEFIPRALRQNDLNINRNPNVQFVNVHSNFIPLPFVNHPLNEIGAQPNYPAMFPPGIPLGFVPPNFVNFVPNQFYAKPTFENIPQKAIVQQKQEETEEIAENVEKSEEKMIKSEVDIAKIVSKLEEAAKEQRQSESGVIKRGMKKGIKYQRKFYDYKGGFEKRRNFERKRFYHESSGMIKDDENKDENKDGNKDGKEKKHIFKNISPHLTPKRYQIKHEMNHQINVKKTSQEISLSPQLKYSETVKKSVPQYQLKASPLKIKEEIASIPKSPNQWIAVSNRKKRKNRSNEEEFEVTLKDDSSKVEEEENVDEELEVVGGGGGDEVLILTKEEEKMIYEDNKMLEDVPKDVIELIRESSLSGMKKNEDVVIQDVQEIEKEMLKEKDEEVKSLKDDEMKVENEEKEEEGNSEKEVLIKKVKKTKKQVQKRILVKDCDFINVEETEEKEEKIVQEEKVLKEVPQNNETLTIKEIDQKPESIPPEKKKPKKKKKIQKINPPLSKSSSTTTLNNPNIFDESYDFLLDTTSLLETNDKTNVEVSEELDKMIQKGLFGNLEEKMKTLNVSIDEDFFKSLNFSKPQSTPDKSGFIKATDLSSILTNNNQFLQKAIDYTKIKPDQASTSKDCAFLDVSNDDFENTNINVSGDLGRKKEKNKGGKLKNKSRRKEQEYKVKNRSATEDVIILHNDENEEKSETTEEIVDGIEEILEDVLKRIDDELIENEIKPESIDQTLEQQTNQEIIDEQPCSETFDQKPESCDEPNLTQLEVFNEQQETSFEIHTIISSNLIHESNFLNSSQPENVTLTQKPEDNLKICTKTYETFEIDDDKRLTDKNGLFPIENDVEEEDDEISSAQEATNEVIVANLENKNPQNHQKSITQAVFEWMVKVREKTPEIEILKSPDTINREFNLNGENDLIKDDEIEEGKDVLEICGKEEEFFKLEEEMEEIKRKRNTKHGDLPYRAICCSLM